MNETNIAAAPAVIQIPAPVPNGKEYTVSSEIWEALKDEINVIVSRIDAGEQLSPEDVTNVRSLKKQVETYLTTFNKAMRDAQTKYKELVSQQLTDLGYDKIETYIVTQRKKQQTEQNTRLVEKQTKLRALVETQLENTIYVKQTVLANELLPAFTSRFPNVNSSAKTKEISNWGPYEAVIKTTLNMLDVFFGDDVFQGAVTLPITSATMQQLLRYVRDGQLDHLTSMREIFAKDADYLAQQKLRAEITSNEVALDKINTILAESETSTDEKLASISQIIRIIGM